MASVFSYQRPDLPSSLHLQHEAIEDVTLRELDRYLWAWIGDDSQTESRKLTLIDRVIQWKGITTSSTCTASSVDYGSRHSLAQDAASPPMRLSPFDARTTAASLSKRKPKSSQVASNSEIVRATNQHQQILMPDEEMDTTSCKDVGREEMDTSGCDTVSRGETAVIRRKARLEEDVLESDRAPPVRPLSPSHIDAVASDWCSPVTDEAGQGCAISDSSPGAGPPAHSFQMAGRVVKRKTPASRKRKRRPLDDATMRESRAGVIISFIFENTIEYYVNRLTELTMTPADVVETSDLSTANSESLLMRCGMAYTQARQSNARSSWAYVQKLRGIKALHDTFTQLVEDVHNVNGSAWPMIVAWCNKRGVKVGMQGKGKMTYVWDWLIHFAYDSSALTTEQDRKSARHALRDQLWAGQRLAVLVEHLGPGVLYVLPENAVSA